MNVHHLVRATDPLSSVMAAENVRRFAPNQYARILSAIAVVSAEQRGATAAEIGEVAGLTVVQVDRRLPELKERGLVAVLQHEGSDLMRDKYRVWVLV